MKPPRRGEPHWDVYVMPVDAPLPPRRVASCLTYEALDAVVRLYGPGEAAWAEVST